MAYCRRLSILHFPLFFQVAMSKYHSVFCSDVGQIYTCGHGLGGRLGQSDEQTYLVSAYRHSSLTLLNSCKKTRYIRECYKILNVAEIYMNDGC